MEKQDLMPDDLIKCVKCGRTIVDDGFSDCVYCRDKIRLLPERYRGMTFETYTIKPDKEPLLLRIKKFIEPERNKGVYLYGTVGGGKTHLAVSCYQSLLGKRIKFVSVPELLLEIRQCFGKSRKESEQELLDKYAEYTYLFLDDFGAEKPSEYTIETLYLIIDRRYRENKNKMFVTSNLSLDKIGDTISDRIASRISEMCDVIKLDDFDHRVK